VVDPIDIDESGFEAERLTGNEWDGRFFDGFQEVVVNFVNWRGKFGGCHRGDDVGGAE
jgi:hypothetical protein